MSAVIEPTLAPTTPPETTPSAAPSTPAEPSSSEPAPPSSSEPAPPNSSSSSANPAPSSEPGTNPSAVEPGQSSQPPAASSQPVNPGASDTGGGVQTTAPPGASQPALPSGSGVQSGSPTMTNGQSAVIVTVTKTDANGNIQTAIETRPISSGSKSNVGPIVGGVVGGVGGAIVIAVLVWLLFRRRKRNYRDDFDDMMFDPARAQNHAPIDLADTADTPHVDPYKYTPVEGVAATSTGHHNQAQYGNYNAYDNYGNQPQMAQASYGHTTVSGTSEPGYANAAGVGAGVASGLSGATSSSGTSAGYAGMGSGYPAGNAPSGYPMAVPTGSGPSDMSHMSPKQREAYEDSQRLAVQNQGVPEAVTVHQDGGAFTEVQTSGAEIPPTYDSIRR
ncbi:hypothetical protein CcaverHIS002_0107810 [Cutaneotrichosporon cavernicola]|uniref:Mid2 domain-containing protein n=1 Tax=Cutaneotrichosporon cavernicola TaxID=279322 RepID=A0AA48L253_9TREE|nr:uncharacterized protein CcaverHIS019_0107760 [Cutaneotrichosporon cavernicola]BEI80252.1 hypothetical protein CcaverHIS002_0107810 [Cutaneotrichosporon cavernicola]BEI88058.1 hypothetical protein CcaverHIS019_0107760 [Cutaneotrichosporon cavernicola]BEJ03603.1 hypothetical protein CcaverHIS641_0107780 [Cutaneotrichosporon cavernicola]